MTDRYLLIHKEIDHIAKFFAWNFKKFGILTFSAGNGSKFHILNIKQLHHKTSGCSYFA